MQALFSKLRVKTCLILFLLLTNIPVVYSQDTQTEREITTAIDDAKSGNYQQAIPILKKYADTNGFDDLLTLQINVYLSFCYLATKNEALNVDGVNKLTDSYLEKYGISKTDSLKRNDEMALLFIAGTLNSNVGNNEKMVYFLSYICEHYEKYHIVMDKGFSEALFILAKRYYDLKDFKTASDIGELAWISNFDLCEGKNNESLDLLNLLYISNERLNIPEKYIEYLEKDVEIRKNLLGEKNPGYLANLYNLALEYLNLASYHKALEMNLKVVELGKEVWGERHKNYIASLSNLASIYSELGDYKKSLEINIEVVKIGKEVLGERDLNYLVSLNNLAMVYIELGEYQHALKICLNDVQLRSNILGEKNPYYLTSFSNLAQCYKELGDYNKSLEINLKIIDLRKEIQGEKNPDYLTSLNNLAALYSQMGNYKQALDISLKLDELSKEVYGDKHPRYLVSYGNLALIYSHIGDYNKALKVGLATVDLEKQVLGEKHPDYLTSLNNLASIYSDMGNYPKALEINIKVAEIRKEVLGEKHPDYLTSLNNLALLYLKLDNYAKALEIFQKVTKLRKDILGDRHPDYLVSLNNLALVYAKIGNYSKSFEINEKVVVLSKEALGERHPNHILSLNNLALDYSDAGEYRKVLEIILKVVELNKEVLGEKHLDYLVSLNNLAMIYADISDYPKALETQIKVVELFKELFGEKHPEFQNSLSNLASVYSDLGDNQKALEINKEVVGLRKEVIGEKHSEYLLSLNNLAITEYNSAETNSALIHYIQMLNTREERLIEYFSLMTEQQRELFWKKYSYSFSLFPMFLEKASNGKPEGTSDAYNIALFSKGLLLNTTLDFDKLIAEKGTPEAIAKFEELKLIKLQIQRLQEKPIDERYLNVDSLENIAQQKETELVKLSKEYGDYTGNMKINWKDVQAKLEEKDVAIEFVEYPTLTDTVKYAALVLRQGWQYPKMISLFRKDQIEEFINQDKNKIYANGYVGKQLKKLIWNPLEDFISPGEQVYFSPSGIIHQLAIENLPVNDSVTIGDRYQMHRLSSTKELAIRKPKEKNAQAVLYGGLKYDLEVKDMLAESNKYEFEKNISYLAMRGYQSDTTVRSGWKFLNGTKLEVDQINNLMKGKQYQVTEYTGETGNEESFKSLSGKREGIIHIATHGFFLPEEESRKNLFMMQRMGDLQQERATVDPMLRSGLIMAGGNKAWQGDTIPEGIEDGVLTSKEISRMDLRGTDLVVLSACETGLGDVSSEGVFGLQRSFKQAGVQTLVMSLWEVSDKATSYMMTEFYANLLSGRDKRASFLEAKQKCKEKFPEPQYWAAFIMLD